MTWVTRVLFRRVLLLGTLALVATLGVASANWLPQFTQTQIDSNWEADRQAPTDGATSVTAFGRDNVLRIGIDSSQTHTDTFRRTEGIKTSGVGDFGTSVQADVYVDPDWAGKAVRAGLWVVVDNGSGDRGYYGILDFISLEPSTSGASAQANHVGWRVWRSTDGGVWTDTSAPFTYGQWFNLRIDLDVDAQLYRYFVNGSEIGTAPANGTFIREVFINSYNYGQDTFPNLSNASYSAHWHAGFEGDIDGDGIPDIIDTQPYVPSNAFSDIPLGNGGATAGRIVSVPDSMSVRLEEVPNPEGIQFYVTGGSIGEYVEIELDGKASTYRLPAGNYVLTDPEQQVTVTTFSGGPAIIAYTLADGSVVEIEVPAGTTVRTTETTEGGVVTALVVDVLTGSARVNGETITAGGSSAHGEAAPTPPTGPGEAPGPDETLPPGALEIVPSRNLSCDAVTATQPVNGTVDLSCRVTSADGSPVSGTTVTFIIVGQPGSGATVGSGVSHRVVTDAQGRASTTLHVGGTSGTLQVEARSNSHMHRYTFTVQGTAAPSPTQPPASSITPPNTGTAGLR